MSEEDKATPSAINEPARVDSAIIAAIGNQVQNEDIHASILIHMPTGTTDDFNLNEDDEVLTFADTSVETLDAEAMTLEDKYLLAEVNLPHGGDCKRAKVLRRVKDEAGNLVGISNNNPILDSRQYEVQFPDGSMEAISANLIAENLMSQVDEEGRSYAILSEIVGHRTNGHAVSKDDDFTEGHRGRHHRRTTTKGWEIQVEWKDGSTSWVPLKDLKESNPVELAEYAVANKIAEEPAFAWWVRHTLRKRDRIIKKAKTKYWAKSHKFGLELPKTVAQALQVDRDTGTDFWRKAIEKEMSNVLIAFEFRDDNIVPKFYKHIECHMIFDVKMDLTRKARLVAGGHQTDPPSESTYSSVVSRDSVRLAFLVAALNDLDILSADVQNAYLNAPTKEKVYTTAGLEFGQENQGRPAIIVRALYGLKSSGARWRDHMAATLRGLNFKNCLADPDVWMKPRVKPNGDKYWEYVLVYVDDVLVISHDPKNTMDELGKAYTLKAGSVKEPDAYLGAEIKKWKLDGDLREKWSMSSDLYVKRAIDNVERDLLAIGKGLTKKATTPVTAGYRPEMDTSPELDERRINYYQGQIGVLRWMCELGRVDILVSVSMLSRYLASPREGHLDQVLHIFAYLKRYNKSSLVFDDTEMNVDETKFHKTDWSEQYPGAEEPIPPNAPEMRGRAVRTHCYVDADHAGCRVTRRSHTGILIYVNRSPIMWHSKRQNTVETSTFGSEFIALKTAVEMIEGLRYKLRMMGIEVIGPTDVLCDNESVVKNSTRSESTLKKKHNAIAYHRVRESQAAKIVRIAWQCGQENLADLFTKNLAGPRLRELAGRILY